MTSLKNAAELEHLCATNVEKPLNRHSKYRPQITQTQAAVALNNAVVSEFTHPQTGSVHLSCRFVPGPLSPMFHGDLIASAFVLEHLVMSVSSGKPAKCGRLCRHTSV